MSHLLWYIRHMIMNDITIALNEYGNAVVDGTEYGTHSFDHAGQEAITIPALDLISYDEGETWRDME